MKSLKTNESESYRLLEIYDWLKKECSGYAIQVIVMEAPSLNSTNKLFTLGEVSGIVKLFAHKELNLDITSIEPLIVKKFVSGNALADKAEVIRAVNSFWSVNTDDNDAADAYALAQIARGFGLGWSIFNRRHAAETLRSILEASSTTKKKGFKIKPTL